MDLSAYIAALNELLNEHGDYELVDAKDIPIPPPEFNNDEGMDPAYVLDVEMY